MICLFTRLHMTYVTFWFNAYSTIKLFFPLLLLWTGFPSWQIFFFNLVSPKVVAGHAREALYCMFFLLKLIAFSLFFFLSFLVAVLGASVLLNLRETLDFISSFLPYHLGMLSQFVCKVLNKLNCKVGNK